MIVWVAYHFILFRSWLFSQKFTSTDRYISNNTNKHYIQLLWGNGFSDRMLVSIVGCIITSLSFLSIYLSRPLEPPWHHLSISFLVDLIVVESFLNWYKSILTECGRSISYLDIFIVTLLLFEIHTIIHINPIIYGQNLTQF